MSLSSSIFCCSAEGFGSRKAGKIMAARKALDRWSDDTDYGIMPGQAFDCDKTKIAAAFAEAVKSCRPDLLTAGPGRINLNYEDHAVLPSIRILSRPDQKPAPEPNADSQASWVLYTM